MPKLRTPFKIFAPLTSTLTISAAAQAQTTLTRVSGVGDDVNQSYAGAISKTAVHGETSRLDPGGNVGAGNVTAVGVMSNEFGQQ
jgi:hypothetical protein